MGSRFIAFIILTLEIRLTDVLGQVGDESLEPLELGDALPVLSDQPFGA